MKELKVFGGSPSEKEIREALLKIGEHIEECVVSYKPVKKQREWRK